jgi:hypothetical protein
MGVTSGTWIGTKVVDETTPADMHLAASENRSTCLELFIDSREFIRQVSGESRNRKTLEITCAIMAFIKQ